MDAIKSGINKVGNNYYQSITQQNSDGSVGTTFYRVDAQGNNGIPIYDVDKPAGSTSLVKSFNANATAEEQKLLSDPNSQLSQVRSQQVISSNPFTNQIQGSTIAQAGGGSGNAASITGSADQQGGSTPTTASTQNQASGGDGTLVYPLKMRSTQQDRLKFTAVEYQPSGNLDKGSISSQNRTSTKDKTIIGSVFLPIQSSISDFNSVEWQGAGLNEIEKLALNTSLQAMNAEKPEGFLGAFESGVKDATKKLIRNQNQLKVYLAQEAIQTQNLLSRFGTVLNPNLELLFSGPQLRPFEFKFQMSAREKAEGENIKKIINFFKKNMAVKKSDGSGVFLKAPNTFLIEYKFNGADTTHPGINLIKECALMSCSVEYTPLGTYMTYQDGTMVSYSMSLSFQELEPIYDVDYKDHPIGY